MMRRVWALFRRGRAAGRSRGRSATAWSDEERVAHLRRLGVRAFSALAYAHRPGMAADLNAWTLDFAARTPGCLAWRRSSPSRARPTTSGGPRPRRPAVQAAPPGRRLPPGRPGPGPGVGPARGRGLPVIVHAGRPGRAPRTPARAVRRGARAAPATARGRRPPRAPEYRDFLGLAETYERVALDTTMMFTDFFDHAPFPRRGAPPAARPRAGREGAARLRLPEHPLPVRTPARRPGPARPRRRLAARGLLAERGRTVRPGH